MLTEPFRVNLRPFELIELIFWSGSTGGSTNLLGGIATVSRQRRGAVTLLPTLAGSKVDWLIFQISHSVDSYHRPCREQLTQSEYDEDTNLYICSRVNVGIPGQQLAKWSSHCGQGQGEVYELSNSLFYDSFSLIVQQLRGPLVCWPSRVSAGHNL